MNGADTASVVSVVACVILGFVIVWRWMGASPKKSSAVPALTDEYLRTNWHNILRVSADATPAQIEAAYQQRLLEIDQVQVNSTASATERRDSELQRRHVNFAHQYASTLRLK
jgi:hypothetical protein